MSIWTAIKTPAAIGREHGTNAGSYVLDGNTSIDTARDILAMSADGDPALNYLLPASPLSGEWASGYSPADLAEECEVDPADEKDMALIFYTYEDAFYQAVEDEVIQTARGIMYG